jgi:hypothetical protein
MPKKRKPYIMDMIALWLIPIEASSIFLPITIENHGHETQKN